MVSKQRAERIADRIQQDLSQILLLESSDPRLVGISITDATVDRELNVANIYVSAIEGSERAEEILSALHHARGYLRSALSARIDLRTFPQLRFHWDPTPEHADHMEKLFTQIRAEKDNKIDQDEDLLDEDDMSAVDFEDGP